MEPSAATSATAEPEISAKKSEAEMPTIARPPRMNPTIAEAKAMSRREIPVAFMIAPARMKSGMAMSGNEVARRTARGRRWGAWRRRPSDDGDERHDAERDRDGDAEGDEEQQAGEEHEERHGSSSGESASFSPEAVRR